MKAPLNQFAERIARNNETREFIVGLIREYGVSPDLVANIAKEEQERLFQQMSDFVHQFDHQGR